MFPSSVSSEQHEVGLRVGLRLGAQLPHLLPPASTMGLIRARTLFVQSPFLFRLLSLKVIPSHPPTNLPLSLHSQPQPREGGGVAIVRTGSFPVSYLDGSGTPTNIRFAPDSSSYPEQHLQTAFDAF